MPEMFCVNVICVILWLLTVNVVCLLFCCLVFSPFFSWLSEKLSYYLFV